MTSNFDFKTSLKIMGLLSGHLFFVPIVLWLNIKDWIDVIWVSYAILASAYFIYKRSEYKHHLLFPYLIAIASLICVGVIVIAVIFLGWAIYFGWEAFVSYWSNRLIYGAK